jgi:hypothetical protein
VTGDSRTETLLALARDLAGVRDAGDEDSNAARLARDLQTIYTSTMPMLEVATGPAADGVFRLGDPPMLAFTPEKLLDLLHQRPGWTWIKTPKTLATTLKPYGLYARYARDPQIRDRTGKGKRSYVYLLDAPLLADLAARYGPAPEPEEGARNPKARRPL